MATASILETIQAAFWTSRFTDLGQSLNELHRTAGALANLQQGFTEQLPHLQLSLQSLQNGVRGFKDRIRTTFHEHQPFRPVLTRLAQASSSYATSLLQVVTGCILDENTGARAPRLRSNGATIAVEGSCAFRFLEGALNLWPAAENTDAGSLSRLASLVEEAAVILKGLRQETSPGSIVVGLRRIKAVKPGTVEASEAAARMESPGIPTDIASDHQPRHRPPVPVVRPVILIDTRTSTLAAPAPRRRITDPYIQAIPTTTRGLDHVLWILQTETPEVKQTACGPRTTLRIDKVAFPSTGQEDGKSWSVFFQSIIDAIRERWPQGYVRVTLEGLAESSPVMIELEREATATSLQSRIEAPTSLKVSLNRLIPLEWP